MSNQDKSGMKKLLKLKWKEMKNSKVMTAHKINLRTRGAMRETMIFFTQRQENKKNNNFKES